MGLVSKQLIGECVEETVPPGPRGPKKKKKKKKKNSYCPRGRPYARETPCEPEPWSLCDSIPDLDPLMAEEGSINIV